MVENLIDKLRDKAARFKFEGNVGLSRDYTQAADAIELLNSAIPHICECCAGCETEKPGGSCPHGFIPSAKRTQEYIAGMQKKYDEVLKAAKQMHLWIFLNSGDEQAAYDECGLTDEMNATLGYGGQFILEPPKEEKK